MNSKSHVLKPGMLVQELDPAGQARIFVVTKLLDENRYCGHDVFSWDDSLAEAWSHELASQGQSGTYKVADNKLWFVDGEQKTLVMTLFELNGERYCVGTTAETKEVSTAEPFVPYEELGSKIRRSMVFFDYNKSTWVLLPSD